MAVIRPVRVGGFPFPVLDPQRRNGNFSEVQQPYTLEQAMASGREAAQGIHEYLMSLEGKHRSLYDYYSVRRTSGRYYQNMLLGKDESRPPP